MPEVAPGEDLESGGAAILVRVRLDSPPFADETGLRIRVERLDDHDVHHFSNVDAAARHLHALLSAVAFPNAGAAKPHGAH